MALTPGDRLGSHEVVSLLGAGGMGVVYKARDTKLGREVAIKVLPEAFSQNQERLARFEREARLLASLNHPNIATIHGLEDADGVCFLVMEHVPGETLAERIAHGPLPMDETFPLFKQIAEGLEEAHETGVIHRDLKPANIKVTPEGKVKILDFGLAKALATEAQTPGTDLSNSPTLTREGTAAGVIMGTAAYMSPEQARGHAVDKRTDIWAFGCCLYEALTGKPTFGGPTVSDILAAILKTDPDWNGLSPSTPQKSRDVLRRCLEKDPRQRLRDIGDARIELEEVANGTPAALSDTKSKLVTRKRMLSLVVATAFVSAVLTGAIIWNIVGSRDVVQRASRVTITVPPEHRLMEGDVPPLAISPDGRKLVLVVDPNDGPPQLYLRSLDEYKAFPMPGTENASQPFFSPDGQWVGFWADGTLQKAAVQGGAPIKICDIPTGIRGASWGSDDTIILGGDNTGPGLWQVPAGGGNPIGITTLNIDRGEGTHIWPEVLPDGREVLFTLQNNRGTGATENSDIGVLSLETGKSRILEGTEGAVQPRYLDSGHLVYARGNSLFAVRFDERKQETAGSITPVVNGVHLQFYSGLQLADFAVSRSGSLAYIPGAGENEEHIVTVDRQGGQKPLVLEKGDYRYRPRLSPDGKRMAVAFNPEQGPSDIWIQDLERGTRTRLTFEGANFRPVWTPDGSRITFASSRRSGDFNLHWKRADGSGEAEPLLTRELGQSPFSWSPDGEILAFVESHPDTGIDIWVLHRDDEWEPTPVLVTPFNETAPAFSPDGRWLAYQSEESGRNEIYVQSFPDPGRKWTISTDGGQEPVWSPSGQELFYRTGDAMMAVAIETDPEFSSGVPRFLFEWQFQSNYFGNYDVTPDGKRFVMIRGDQKPLVELNVILDWSEELKRLVPVN